MSQKEEKGTNETHAFVYDSNFNEFQQRKYYGTIIDNRENSYLRAFCFEDKMLIQSGSPERNTFYEKQLYLWLARNHWKINLIILIKTYFTVLNLYP